MKRSSALLGLVLAAACLPLAAQSQANQVASYTMDVRLDTNRHLLAGREVLTWTNTSPDSLPELWFHLYWNAFANNASTFVAEARRQGQDPVGEFRKGDWGYSRVEAIRIIRDPAFEGYDLKPSLTFRHPDDANGLDRTVFSVRLPKPLPPGETIVLDIRWEGKVPKTVARAGYVRDYYLIGQWFPKIGVYLDGRWNCHQYHEASEFFADYGTYDVRLTLPSTFVVGATGRRVELVKNADGTSSHRFVQENVHDFAWAASPRFLEFHQRFAFAPDKETEVILLLEPEHLRLKERYLKAIMTGVRQASRLYGDYPYETVTCVDPAFASGTGGMEYPTFFTAGAYFLDPEGSGDPELVTIHEFGHGYFYGLVGSNEFENAWMDEGFTSFLETEIYDLAYGPRLFTRTYFGIPVTFPDVRIPVEAAGISEARNEARPDIMQRRAWEFLDSTSYGANSYGKAQVMLLTLERFLGADVFGPMIKDYSQSFWYKHPKPGDFYEAVNRHAGRDMTDILDQFVYGSGTCDYALDSIANEPATAPRGWFDAVFRDAAPDKAKRVFDSSVVVRRLGEVRLPVEVEVVFEDGRKCRDTWDGQYLWKRFTYHTPVPIERAAVDPDFKIVADVNRTNNSLTLSPNAFAPWKWVVHWMGWLQHALEFFSVLGG